MEPAPQEWRDFRDTHRDPPPDNPAKSQYLVNRAAGKFGKVSRGPRVRRSVYQNEAESRSQARRVVFTMRKTPSTYKEITDVWAKGGTFFNSTRLESYGMPTMDGLQRADYGTRDAGISYFAPFTKRGDHRNFAEQISRSASGLFQGIAATFQFAASRLRDTPRATIERESGGKLAGAGSFNAYFRLAPPGSRAHNAETWDHVNSYLNFFEAQTGMKVSPEQRLKLGVRVSIKPLPARKALRDARPGEMGDRGMGEGKVIDFDDQIDALYDEAWLQMMLATHDLALPIYGTAMIAYELIGDVAVPNQYFAASLVPDVDSSLEDALLAIRDRWMTERAYREDTRVSASLDNLGLEMLRVVQGASRLGVLMIDIKPDNMLYQSLGIITHKVYLADFDSFYTVLFDVRTDPDHAPCIELLNLLALMHFLKCKHGYGVVSGEAPVLDIATFRLRRRILELGEQLGMFDAEGNPIPREEGLGTSMCGFLTLIAASDAIDANVPLWTGDPSKPMTQETMQRAARMFQWQIRHYARENPGHTMPSPYPCWPYNEQGSLILQMFAYLSKADITARDYTADARQTFHQDALIGPYSEGTVSGPIRGYSDEVLTNCQPPRKHLVVDEVFASLGLR